MYLDFRQVVGRVHQSQYAALLHPLHSRIYSAGTGDGVREFTAISFPCPAVLN